MKSQLEQAATRNFITCCCLSLVAQLLAVAAPLRAECLENLVINNSLLNDYGEDRDRPKHHEVDLHIPVTTTVQVMMWGSESYGLGVFGSDYILREKSGVGFNMACFYWNYMEQQEQMEKR